MVPSCGRLRPWSSALLLKKPYPAPATNPETVPQSRPPRRARPHPRPGTEPRKPSPNGPIPSAPAWGAPSPAAEKPLPCVHRPHPGDHECPPAPRTPETAPHATWQQTPLHTCNKPPSEQGPSTLPCPLRPPENASPPTTRCSMPATPCQPSPAPSLPLYRGNALEPPALGVAGSGAGLAAWTHRRGRRAVSRTAQGRLGPAATGCAWCAGVPGAGAASPLGFGRGGIVFLPVDGGTARRCSFGGWPPRAPSVTGRFGTRSPRGSVSRAGRCPTGSGAEGPTERRPGLVAG